MDVRYNGSKRQSQLLTIFIIMNKQSNKKSHAERRSESLPYAAKQTLICKQNIELKEEEKTRIKKKKSA